MPSRPRSVRPRPRALAHGRRGVGRPVAAATLAVVSALGFGLAPAFATGHDPQRGTPGASNPYTPIQEVLTDFYGKGPLTERMVDLIDGAADGSTVNLKTYYFHDDGALPHQVVTALKNARTKRGVHVNVLVQRGAGAYSTKEWKAFVKYMKFATIHTCTYSCTTDPVKDSVTHSKFLTVSNLAGLHQTAVLETSTNISQQQLGRTIQSGVLFEDNQTAYKLFAHEFAKNVACSEGACIAPVAPVTAPINDQTGVIFAPFTGRGPWTVELRRTTAQPGCSISLMSITIHDVAMTDALARLKSEGCQVRVIVEHRRSDDGLTPLKAKGGVNHEKVLVIQNGSRQMVYAGSLDFSYGAEHLNNQQMIASSDPEIVSAYAGWFAQIWSSSKMTYWK